MVYRFIQRSFRIEENRKNSISKPYHKSEQLNMYTKNKLNHILLNKHSICEALK